MRCVERLAAVALSTTTVRWLSMPVRRVSMPVRRLSMPVGWLSMPVCSLSMLVGWLSPAAGSWQTPPVQSMRAALQPATRIRKQWNLAPRLPRVPARLRQRQVP
ncbi:MAG TPA: hypothetical protein VLN42_04140 [Casimicrobiaceae bacterium]|nr:hypothetical protein [Casimicrobiaceae bacterium]